MKNSELKQVTFLTTRTSTGSKVDVFHQSQPLMTQSSDVTHAVRVVKNVTCLSSLISPLHPLWPGIGGAHSPALLLLQDLSNTLLQVVSKSKGNFQKIIFVFDGVTVLLKT